MKDKIREFENDGGYDKSYNGYKEYCRNKNPKVKKEYNRYLTFKSDKNKLKKLVSKNEKLETLGEPDLKGKEQKKKNDIEKQHNIIETSHKKVKKIENNHYLSSCHDAYKAKQRKKQMQ